MKKSLFTLICSLGLYAAIAQPSVNIAPFANGFSDGITDIQNAGDSRLFVVEQLGYITIVDSTGSVLPTMFLNIHNKVTPTTFTPGDEQGLLGLAFSPDFESDGYFYVNYTDKEAVGNTVIARYQVDSVNPDIADPASEEILLYITQPFPNHNGGALAFGDDGYLYIALGDGGSIGDPDNRAQSPDSLLGKILRIDVSSAPGYTIPATNPFASGGGAPEVWAYGLRNPFKITFDRDSNNLWIADVGQFEWEEINFQPDSSLGGENYGWRCYEGNNPYNPSGCQPLSTYDGPVYEYSHIATSGCAVVGGYVYRGSLFPNMEGYYFFSDYCTGEIYTLNSDSSYAFATAGIFSGNMFTTFGENSDGELFVGSQSNGILYKIEQIFTGIDSHAELLNDMVIYPNPGHGIFTCEINSSAFTKTTIEISDITGRVCYSDVKSLQPGITHFTLDLNELSSGSYQVKIYSDQAALYDKIEILK